MDNVQYSLEAERNVIFVFLVTNEITFLPERKYCQKFSKMLTHGCSPEKWENFKLHL